MTRRSLRLIPFGLAIVVAVLCAQSDDWYQNRDHIFKNRWEGLFGENQGSPEWELRSFVANVEPYPPNKNVDLKVTYYVPDSTKAFLKATTINRTPSYLMVPRPDALKEQGGWWSFEGWSTRDVLLQNKIPSDNLGVLIRLGADSEAVHRLAPAIIYFSNKPKQLATYRLDFNTALAINDSSFTVLGQKGYSHKYKLSGAGPRSTIPIEFKAGEIPDGLTRLVLNLQYDDGTKRPLEWTFYSKGLP